MEKEKRNIKIGLIIIFLLAWFLIGIVIAVIVKSQNAQVTENEGKPLEAVEAEVPTNSPGIQTSGEPTATTKAMFTPEATQPAIKATVIPETIQSVVEVRDEAIVDFSKALYTYEEMVVDLAELQARYPEHITFSELGKTADGRGIYEVVVGNPKASKKIVVQASIHGREHMNTIVAMRQIEELLSGYDNATYNGILYKELLNDVSFHIIPMANPDGVTISQRGIDGINSVELKNILQQCYQNDGASDVSRYWARWKANAKGVDLNRNFDARWQEFQGSTNPSFEKYKGSSPASEVETQLILQLVHEVEALSVISYHSAGNLIYWDYGSVGDIHEADRQLAQLVGQVTGYGPQSSVQSATDAAGCSDYFVLEEGIPAVTIENGGGECPLSIGEFDAIWNANRELLPALAAFYK